MSHYQAVKAPAVLKTALIFLCFLLLPGLRAGAQCINAFPYLQDFETAPGWTSGGINSDWAWGTPAHPLINSAASGSKCWCVGSLTGSFYEYSAQSYLMSPCFNFSGLAYPYISFKIFWETEWKWDGLVLQYSTDGGASWTNLGAFGDAENCMTQNWFNHNNVSWLTSASVKHGWTGRVGPTAGSCSGGNGSAEWVEAKHCMSMLAGQPNVRFRFLFGSGSSCNDFDGIAIDDIFIADAPANASAFEYTCTGVHTITFTNLSGSCPTGFSWNFGDPASGSANLSTEENPTHVFSSPGTYNVSLTVTGPCNAPGTFTQTVSILEATASGTNVTCNGLSNGSAAASVVGGTGAYTYAWNTTPAHTGATLSGLSPGTYTVTVSNAGSCPDDASVTITEPAPLSVTAVSGSSCTDVCNGTLGASAAGGVSPYVYSWGAAGAGASLSGICVGAYTVSVSDANGCLAAASVQVTSFDAPLLFCTPLTICTGSAGLLSASGALTYTWSPAAGLSATTGSAVWAAPPVTSTYVLTGTSAQGCSSSLDVPVTVDPAFAPQAAFVYSPDLPGVYNPEVQFVNTSAGNNTYTWYLAGLDTTTVHDPVFVFPSDSGAIYTVCLVAVNEVGCADTLCRLVPVEGWATVFVPNAFSPNGDGLNDLFFPVLRDVDAKALQWTVMNRWRQVVFESHAPDAVWDGTRHGEPCKTDVYVWKIRYIEKSTGIQREKTGSVSLLR